MSLLWRKLVRDMRARRGPFLALAATSLLGVALFGGTYDAYQNLVASYDQMFVDTSFADVVAVGGDSAAIAREASGLPGVAAVSVRSVADVPFEVGTHGLMGRVVEAPGSGPVDGVIVLDGTRPAPASRDEVMVEQHMGTQFGLRSGSTLRILGAAGWMPVRVAATVASSEYLWPARSRQSVFVPPGEFGVVFAPAAVLRALPADAVVTQALVLFDAGADRTALTARFAEIARAHGAADTFTKAEQPSNAALHEDISGFGELSLMFPLLFLGASALATYVLLSRLVRMQRAQIGLLLANGFAPRTVLVHYLSFGLAAALAGGIPGALLGALLGAEITGEYTAELAIPIRLVESHPLTIALGVAFAAVAGALSALAPAVAAARLVPADAMRAVAPAARGGRSIVERVLPAVRGIPTRWLLVPRGIERNRLRSASTVVGVALAITLILVSWGMLDTTQLLLERQFGEIQRDDAEMLFATPVSADRIAAIGRVAGVAAVEPVNQIEASVRRGDKSYGTSLVAYRADTTMHRFLDAAGHEVPLTNDGVLLGAAAGDTLGARVGDDVEIVLPATGAHFHDRIAGFVSEPLGTYAYLTIDHLASSLGAAPAADGVLVRYQQGADPAAMRERLMAENDVVAFVDTKSLAHLIDQFMGLFYAFVGTMLALGAVMSFALIFTTMTVNVSERSTEIATLRANGMTRRTIGRLLGTENMLLTLIGIVPGFVLGYAAAWAFMRSFSSDLFNFDVAIRPSTYLFIALAVLAVAFLSQRPALRAVGSIDIGREIRVLSL